MCGCSRLARIPFVAEAAQRFRGGQPGRQELDGDPLLELPVVPLREPDGAHAAAADLADQAIWADQPAGQRTAVVGEPGRVDGVERAGSIGLGEQRSHFRHEPAPLAARRVQEGLALIRGQVERVAQQPLDVGPGRFRHAPCAPTASPRRRRWSHSLATAKCRLTVAGATPRTAAVSGTERPPKNRSSTMRA